MNKEKKKKQVLRELEQVPIVQYACKKVGLGRSTFYKWREEDAKFKEGVEKAIHEGDQFINDMAESQLISAIKDKNLRAIIHWLKHHHSVYKNKLEIEGSVKHEVSTLTQEQEELIERSLNFSGMLENPKLKNEESKRRRHKNTDKR